MAKRKKYKGYRQWLAFTVIAATSSLSQPSGTQVTDKGAKVFLNENAEEIYLWDSRSRKKVALRQALPETKILF